MTIAPEFVDRTTQEPDVIYVHTESDAAFVTPDGIGRYWFDSEDEAVEEYGEDLPIEYVDHICDWDECDLNDNDYCHGGQ